jgi:hypothetical protein
MLNIRGMSTVENLLTGVNRFGHDLTIFDSISAFYFLFNLNENTAYCQDLKYY